MVVVFAWLGSGPVQINLLDRLQTAAVRESSDALTAGLGPPAARRAEGSAGHRVAALALLLVKHAHLLPHGDGSQVLT